MFKARISLMYTAGHLDLTEKGISSSSYLKHKLAAKDFARFKSMTRFCSTPIHLSEPGERDSAVFMAPSGGVPADRVCFSPSFNAEAELFRLSNPTLGNPDLLSVSSAGWIGPDLSLLVRRLSYAEAQTVSASGLAAAAAFSAFPMAFFTLIDGTSRSGERLLLGMGKGSVPHSALASQTGGLWQALALEGVSCRSGAYLKYAGLAIGTGEADAGRMTIIGIAKGEGIALESGASYEALDVPFEREETAAVVHSRKGIISKDFQVALSVAGYLEWGPAFLKLADK